MIKVYLYVNIKQTPDSNKKSPHFSSVYTGPATQAYLHRL